ncbi:MAG: M28 family peptidase [Saprospiraceae bacterium]|nr:M28 family peptidase [Saprospiraceae bacterium]
MKYLFLTCVVVILIFPSCKQEESLPEISQETIARHMAVLASDDFQGRMPCSPGEVKTVDYLVEEMEKMNLNPGNGDSYLQDVPLLEIDTEMTSDMVINTKGGVMNLKPGEDFVVNTERAEDDLSWEDTELVFCGFGIVSEKDNWNDYADMDMTGKTAVVLVNDPGFGSEDADFFKGNTMTYGGRWSTKYDFVDDTGADGILIIHEASMAGYPWFVIQSSWTGPQQGLAGIDRSQDARIKGWIHLEAAKELFEKSGQDLSSMIKEARKPGFQPVPLDATASVSIESSYSTCISKNVIGIVEGKKNPEEYILYTAHWDHIGIGTPVDGDSIYNGALDNASGTSTVLAIAEMHANVKTPPDRSVIFLFVTAEEQGLLGSEYYAQYPLFPHDQTVANLNMDGVNPAGIMNDLTIIGMGHSDMDDVAAEEAGDQNRYVLNEQEPEKGYFFRSDQFSFAKKGVPVLFASGGYDHRKKGKEYAKQFLDDYTASRYHAPADNYDPENWEFGGMVQDGQLYFNVGLRLANSEEWPKWKPDSEFSRPVKLKN